MKKISLNAQYGSASLLYNVQHFVKLAFICLESINVKNFDHCAFVSFCCDFAILFKTVNRSLVDGIVRIVATSPHFPLEFIGVRQHFNSRFFSDKSQRFGENRTRDVSFKV